MDEELKNLFSMFLESSRDHLTELDNALVALEKGDASAENLDAIRRHLHTIKGSCSMFGLLGARDTAHALEDMMTAVIERGGLRGEAADLLFEGADLLRELIGGHVESVGAASAEDDPRVRDLCARIAGARGEVESAGYDARIAARTLFERIEEVRDEFGELYDFEPIDDAVAILRQALARGPDESGTAGDGETAESDALGPAAPEEEAEAGGPAAASRRGTATETFYAEKTVRVPERKIDAFLENVGELISVAEVGKYLERQFATVGLTPETRREFRAMSMSLDEQVFGLQNELMDLRRVALRQILGQFPRLVRDLGQELGKEVDLVVEGEDELVDKSLLEIIEACLVQLVRNAVAHGFETPRERTKAGKPPVGRLVVRALPEEKFLRLEIADDGRGLDLEGIGRKALALGFVTPERLERLDENERAMLIFQSGLSTSKRIDMASGRGVGLDVVANEVQALGGHLGIETEPGRGTTISVRIPLNVTLSVIGGIIARTESTSFVVPTNAVVESVSLSRELLTSVKGEGEALKLRGRLIPLCRTRELFGLDGAGPRRGDNGVAVVLQAGERVAALVFDALLDIQQVVVKTISGVTLTRQISGGAILGDGSVGLVIDPEGLLVEGGY
jgi:two-component system, chemotaxis family, sensor kinase CheA